MRQSSLLVATVVAFGAGSTACASKKYVNTRVGEVNDRVTTLGQTLEETQEATRQNAARLARSIRRPTRSVERADAAGRSATEARSAADSANAKAVEVDKASRRLVYEVVLSDDKSKFTFGEGHAQRRGQG